MPMPPSHNRRNSYGGYRKVLIKVLKALDYLFTLLYQILS